MSSLVRILLFLWLVVVLDPARVAAQGTWRWDASLPDFSYPAFCYDPFRDRMVMFAGGPTVEYDPVVRSWTGLFPTSPSPIHTYPVCGLAYDYGRQRVVFHGTSTTWTWDGTIWSPTTIPANYWLEHLIGHKGRGTVMAFGGVFPSNDLYEWDGATWNLVPTTIRPPRPVVPLGYFRYRSSAYDARRDKIVLFGSAEFFSEGGYANASPILWEWDASQGWVNRSVTFPITFDPWASAYFDAHRGTVIALVWSFAAGLQKTFEWDGGNSWQELIGVVSAPPMSLESLFQGYDSLRDQTYTMFADSNNYHFGYIYENTHPARFEPQGSGCPGSLGQSELHLLHPWTRAWLGRTLEVELTNLPQSVGAIVTGFSDQQSGQITLPAALDGYGMPGCFARVSTDATNIIGGSGNHASLGLPVPVSPSLLGVTVFQQGCSLDPGFNCLGLTVSNSVRSTIGHL